MTRQRLLLPLALAGVMAAAPLATSAPAFAPGEAIVKFRDAPRQDQVAALDAGGAKVQEWLPSERTAVVEVIGSNTTTIQRLESDPRVEWAEPNYIVRSLAVPNDALFGDQWGLLNSGQNVDGSPGTAGADIGVTTAWETTTGADHVSVAIVDGGVELNHPDLAPNMTLTNPGETGNGKENNRIDDDGNGLVDDWRGWDWVSADNDPTDLGVASHGSVVAGVIGARGNNGAGIAGTLWTARMMALRVLNEQGNGRVSDVSAAFSYAGALGVRIVNASLGGSGLRSQALNEAVSLYPDTLFVFASGNDGSNNDGGAAVFPCDLPFPNVLCVGATDQNDALAAFSNFGAASVDIAAPGQNIMGTTRGNQYGIQDGTSFAAPFATGVAGLVLAANPGARTAQIRSAVINGATPLPSLAGRVASGARLHAPGALANVPPAGAAPAVSERSATELDRGSAVFRGVVTPTDGPASFFFEYGTTPALGSRTHVMRAGAAARPVRVGYKATGLKPNTRYHYRVVAADVDGLAVSKSVSFVSPPRKTTVTVKTKGREALLRLGLAGRSTVSGTLLRRRIITRNKRRVATFVKSRRVVAKVSPAGRRVRRIGILSPGRYRVKLQIREGGKRRNLIRNFRVAPKAPRVTRITTKGRTRIVNLRLFSRAKVNGRVERLSGRKFARVAAVRRRALASGNRLVALPSRLRKGRYRVVLNINEGGRKTTRVTRFRI